MNFSEIKKVEPDLNNNTLEDQDVLGTSGLINQGNTCYMNSIIQCLSNCEDFRNLIIGKDLIPNLIDNESNIFIEKNKLESYLSYQLRKIFINIWNSSFYSFRPISFRKLFGKKIEQFQNSNQQDSQEALLCILDSINDELAKDADIKPLNKTMIYDYLEHLHFDEYMNHEAILKIIKSNLSEYLKYKSINDYRISHKKFSPINSIFEGRTISQLVCSETNGVRTNFESFFYLTIALPQEKYSNTSDSESSEMNEDKSNENDKEKEKTLSENQNSSFNIYEYEYSNESESNESDKESEKESEKESDQESDEESDQDSVKSLSNLNTLNLFKKVNNKSLKKYTLYDLLNNHIIPEKLDNDNKWFSPYANKLVDAEKINLIWESPKILIILLKRFEYSYNGAIKLNNIIEFPFNNLDITPYLHPNHVSEYTKYDLFAINNHTNFSSFGFNGISFGHYYSYCKNYTNDKWYNYDDETVNEIDENDLITEHAYMLFYKAIN